MKALSVRAPWWWAILHGKPVENRDWYTNFRGRVWLHAGKWWDQEEVEDELFEIEDMAQKDGLSLPLVQIEAMRALGGNLVGTIEIVDCVANHPSAFFVGKYGFVLRAPEFIKHPIPFKGALGFFDVPDSISQAPC
jgi:hypothetical protein